MDVIYEKLKIADMVVVASSVYVYCVNASNTILYEVGTISIMQAGVPYEVAAGSEGPYLFAKFMPALC